MAHLLAEMVKLLAECEASQKVFFWPKWVHTRPTSNHDIKVLIDGIQIGGATVDYLDHALFFCPA